MKSERDFWSRRRAAVQAEDLARKQQADADDAAQAQAALAERPEAEVLAELGLPVPEAVCSGDDLSGFMARAVPEYLRRRALRSLWKSNPVLACLDGLNDYDGDFTNAATDAPGVKTAYRVGKGLKAHIDHLAAQAQAKEEAQVDADEFAQAEPAALDEPMPPAPVAEPAVEPDADEPAAAASVASADIPETPIRPRRMAFRIEEAGA